MPALRIGPGENSGVITRALLRLQQLIADKNNLVLCGIVGAGAFFRLWNLSHLFNAIFDSDEGVYSLAARFITQGYLPYRDFTLAHPPLHTLLLSGIYKIFGYDFLYGRYLSVSLSLISIVLIYIIGKRLYHPRAGLAAALIFAVSPEMVYLGRRVVQEPLGILLVLVAVLVAVDFIRHNRPRHLFYCGLFLGLAVATKYTFIPAALAVAGALLALNLGERFFRVARILGDGAFWITYICSAVLIFALLLLSKTFFNLPLSLPFVDPVHWSVLNIVGVFMLFGTPFIIAVIRASGAAPLKGAWRSLVSMPNKGAFGLLILGIIAGYALVDGYFLINMPHDFWYQTVLIQQAKPLVEIPSFIMIRVAFYSLNFSKLAFLSILLSIPAALLIMRKPNLSRSDAFFGTAILFSFLFAQDLICLPRYYVSVVLFFYLGLAAFIPATAPGFSLKKMKSVSSPAAKSVMVLLTLAVLFTSVSAVLLKDYIGYDIGNPFQAPDTGKVYAETAAYLQSVGAKRVFSVNPIYVALAPGLTSTLDMDSYGLLWLEGIPAEKLIKDKIFEGVDYVVIDAWVRWWNDPTEQQLIAAVEKFGRLATVIEPDSIVSTAIYTFSGQIPGRDQDEPG